MAGVSAETVTVFRIGSFNVGVDQDMLTGRELAAQERRLANNGQLVIGASASQPSANSAEAEVGRQPVDQQRHDLVMHQEVIEEVQEELTFSWIERNGCHYDEHWDIVFRGFECQVPLPPWGYEWRPGDEQGEYVLRDENNEMPWYYPWR